MKGSITRTANTLRRKIHERLEQSASDASSRALHWFLVALTVTSLVATVCESVPALHSRYGVAFAAVETCALVVFSIEYVLRIWTAAEHSPGDKSSAWRARWRYVVSAWGIIDLIAVLPMLLALFSAPELRVLLIFRVLRFLKLGRYSPGMRSLVSVLYTERRALFGCLVIMMGATFFAATLMYVAERTVQPEKLGTIPDAMWWAIVTLGTIGYGDVVPMTLVGKVIATATIFTGLIMVALPVGIIATAFADEIHRRDFIITWGMVARVPLFAELTAANIADIMQLLRARRVGPGEVITRRGEPAHAMYFISSGEIEIRLRHKRIQLGSGHFFGEVAALRNARRSATATALTRANLFVLDAQDLRVLMDREPVVADHIRRVVKTRIGRDIVSTRGDILSEELEEGVEANSVG